MTVLEAGRILTEFYWMGFPLWGVLENLSFQAGTINKMDRSTVGKPEWHQAARAWSDATEEERQGAARVILLEELDAPGAHIKEVGGNASH